MKRNLSLKSESLIELEPADLSNVVGGALPTTPVKECVSDPFYTLQATRCFCP